MVRFFALYRIKPHVPPLISYTANSFEFKPCGRTPQARCLRFCYDFYNHQWISPTPIVDGADYWGI
jgi:hypothetical protein